HCWLRQRTPLDLQRRWSRQCATPICVRRCERVACSVLQSAPGKQRHAHICLSTLRQPEEGRVARYDSRPTSIQSLSPSQRSLWPEDFVATQQRVGTPFRLLRSWVASEPSSALPSRHWSHWSPAASH